MIELKSTNPQLSFIIRKNPNTQNESKLAFERELRKGKIYGWYSDENTFRMLFVDSKTESSFNRQDQFEYLDRTRYSSSYIPVAAIGNLLASAMKERSEFDLDGYDNSFSCLIEIANFNLAKRMLRNMPEIQLEPIVWQDKPCRDLFRMTVSTTKSIYHMLNVIQVFCIMQAIEDWNLWIPMDVQSVTKYVRSLNVIEAPYYLRYTLQAFGIQSPEVFEKILADLAGENYIINFGKTDQHRLNGIVPVLGGGPVLWDIGCGELKYTRKLAKNYKKIIACDGNPIIQEKNEFRLKNRGIENVELRGLVTPESFADFQSGSDILMTEVLEHMPKDDAIAILKVIAQLPFHRAVFTLPNREFNQFYGMEEGTMRHDDHHYEPTRAEVLAMFAEAGFDVVKLKNVVCSDAVRVGDDLVYATHGIQIVR